MPRQARSPSYPTLGCRVSRRPPVPPAQGSVWAHLVSGPWGSEGDWGPSAHIEWALQGGLVDPVEGTVFLALAAGEVEEAPDG